MKVDSITKLAQDYSDAIQEFNALMEELGGKAEALPKPKVRKPVLVPPSSMHPAPVDTGSRNSGIIARLDERLKPLAERFLAAVSQQGIPLVLTQGFRSMEEQRRIYEQGRTAPGHIVTYAPPEKSKHNYGLAFDVAPLNEKGQPYWPEDEDLWTRIGEIGESVGLRWGGRWPGVQRDRPHFELRAPAKAV